MQLFDTHTHVNFQPFLAEYKAVIQRALDDGVYINNVGSQWESSERTVRIADEFEHGVWASIGLHPIHVFTDVTEEQEIDGKIQKIKARAEEFDYEKYKELALSSNKVIAIGECGLDYYHFKREDLQDQREQLIQKQIEALKLQIDLALELDIPVVFHCRDAAVHQSNGDDEDKTVIQAFEDLIALIKEYQDNGKRVRGVIHCYTGIPRYVPEFLKLGLYLGYTGIISFDNAKEVQASLQATPLDRILLETDAPYLTPVPHRGKRNEPSFVQYVANKAAELKGVSVEKLATHTTQNAFNLFRVQANREH